MKQIDNNEELKLQFDKCKKALAAIGDETRQLILAAMMDYELRIFLTW